MGRRVRRGARINGVWKYNQDKGVIVGSQVSGDRRMYTVEFADYGTAVTPLPSPKFELIG